jgi:cell division transport system permease protein
MTGALRHHWHSLVHSLGRLRASPVATLLNALVIGIALALPLAGYAMLEAVQGMLGSLPSHQAEVSVFLVPQASAADIEELGRTLRRQDGVAQVRFVSRDAALAGLKRSAGIGEIANVLRENPLPDAFVVTLGSADADVSERLVASARASGKVAQVQADSAWLRRVQALLRAGRTAVVLLAVFLALGLVAITFNTIRLQVLTHRDEIEVSRLIGATDAYIRRPFLYLGTLQGLAGALLAWLVVAGAASLLRGDLGAVGELYGTRIELAPPGWNAFAAVAALAAVVGWAGALLSVSIYLRQKA